MEVKMYMAKKSMQLGNLNYLINDRYSGNHYIAEATTIEDKLSKKSTVLEEIELGLFTGFEDTTALEDQKESDSFSAIAVVGCILKSPDIVS